MDQKVRTQYPEIMPHWDAFMSQLVYDQKLKNEITNPEINLGDYDSINGGVKYVLIVTYSLLAIVILMMIILLANTYEAMQSPIRSRFYRFSIMGCVGFFGFLFIVLGIGLMVGCSKADAFIQSTQESAVKNVKGNLFKYLNDFIAKKIENQVALAPAKDFLKTEAQAEMHSIVDQLIQSFRIEIKVGAAPILLLIAGLTLIGYLVAFCMMKLNEDKLEYAKQYDINPPLLVESV